MQYFSPYSKGKTQLIFSVQSKRAIMALYHSIGFKLYTLISCFTVGYREISVKIFFDFTQVPPVKSPIFMFLLLRLTALASQPDGNMTSFTLHFSRLK